MNDLYDIIEHSALSFYADDSKLFRAIDDLKDSTEMSEDIVRLENLIA